VYVGRPGGYGNPYDWRDHGRMESIDLYRFMLLHWKHDDPRGYQEMLDSLRGKDLACWCPLVDKDGNPVPCHADVLLELANEEEPCWEK